MTLTQRSLRSIALIAGVLGRAGELGQKRRKKDAKDGVVPWRNPPDVQKYMELVKKQGERESQGTDDAAAILQEIARTGELSRTPA